MTDALTVLFDQRSVDGKGGNRYYFNHSGHSADAYDGMTPTVDDPDIAGVRAQRLVAMCRISGMHTTRTPANHFTDDEELFTLDTRGDASKIEFECPPTLAEMLVIAHEYQDLRNSTHSTPEDYNLELQHVLYP